MHWALQQSLQRIQQAQLELWGNLPFRPLAWLLRLWTFPTGLPFQPPADRLEHRVAGLLLQPSEARDRLTRHVFISRDPSDSMGAMELALSAVSAATPIEKTLWQA